MIISNKCVFVGCSLTAGAGFKDLKSDSNLWCNILHRSQQELASLSYVNAGKGGITNHEIFRNAVEMIVEHSPKYIFVQWTELFRINIAPGIETHTTEQMLVNGSTPASMYDIVLHDRTYSKKYIYKVKNRLSDLQNSHYLLLDVLRYCQVLSKLAEKTNSKIYFINGAISFEFDKNYFIHNTNNDRTPDKLTKFTQKLLDVKTRDDEEIFKIYDKIHLEYKNTGGLKNWLNLDRSMVSDFRIDRGDDNLHPGPIGNQKFAEYLLEIYQAIA